MFYCDECAERAGYPHPTFTSSHGRCEMCEKVRTCNDMPSSALPMPRKRTDDEGKPDNDPKAA